MRDILKKLIVSALIVAMVLPVGSAIVSAENTENTDTQTQTDSSTEESTDEPAVTGGSGEISASITEAEALAAMKKVAESEKLELYFNETTINFAVKVKSTGYVWWSEPFNADASLTQVQKNTKQMKEIKSALSIATIKTKDGSTTSTTYSTYGECVAENAKGSYEVKEIDKGVKVTYDFSKSVGVKIPVEYTLVDDYFQCKVLATQITEDNKSAKQPVMLTGISVMPSFGAADDTEDGYFVIPDGSGAVINFNNGKNTYSAYSQPVYGRDITEVLIYNKTDNEQVYMPVIGIVKKDNAMLEVATEGAERATINAYVSGQNNTRYNNAYFSFTTRAADKYYIGNDPTNWIDMYENANTKFMDYSVRYYPISEEGADYNSVAAQYRNYLTNDLGVKKKTEANNSSIYVDLYGGVVKETSVIGIPVKVKTAATTFDQAQEILKELKESGVDDVVVNYKDWNTSSIEEKICTKFDPAKVLGGKSDFKSLNKYAKENGINIYYNMETVEFGKSGNGCNTLFDAAVRLTKAYSRQTKYDPAWGIEDEEAGKWSLLTPKSLNDVFSKISNSFTKNKIENVSLGTSSYKLYGDYGKRDITRADMAKIVSDGYTNVSEKVGSILAETANQYVLPSVDCITNVPLYSSGYDVFDYDIPFYQIVLHGLVPYSSEAINGSADSDEMFMLAIASGSNVGYDFLYTENKKLQNTDYNKLYYANFNGWSETVANQYKLVSDILSSVSDQSIVSYKFIDKETVETTYENGTVTVINYEKGTIKLNGEDIKLSDYNLKGGINS